MDSGFEQHKALTVTHILPAALFMVLIRFSSSAASARGASPGIGGPGGFWSFSASSSACLPS
jgi:hypothetical protein